ncbi:hypothetical protein EYF80_017399 [Liparis tanakae]|uniref:Uncharacterized protein n=1 Tax=Liparis tanakae TaxID=230148 RepID=A0A4Z2I3G8_9TELE|nr:hypothetical protein EYF80_017399 [Liparis tanakae]
MSFIFYQKESRNGQDGGGDQRLQTLLLLRPIIEGIAGGSFSGAVGSNGRRPYLKPPPTVLVGGEEPTDGGGYCCIIVDREDVRTMYKRSLRTETAYRKLKMRKLPRRFYCSVGSWTLAQAHYLQCIWYTHRNQLGTEHVQESVSVTPMESSQRRGTGSRGRQRSHPIEPVVTGQRRGSVNTVLIGPMVQEAALGDVNGVKKCNSHPTNSEVTQLLIRHHLRSIPCQKHKKTAASAKALPATATTAHSPYLCVPLLR